MTSDDLGPHLTQLYTAEELVELVRDNLRYARAFPPGPQRNQHRQIVTSLRALFKNSNWLNAHTQPNPNRISKAARPDPKS
jgi:hypothetical protein